MVFVRRRAPASGLARRVMSKFAKRKPMRRAAPARRMTNPMPTFTETFRQPQQILGNTGGTFAVSIAQLPQLLQYSNLYRQYRINWVKVMIFSELGGDAVDVNTLFQNNAGGVAGAGVARIAYAINDTPNLPPPASEADILTDNGCRVKIIRGKWSTSFKPVVDQEITTGGVAGVGQRQMSKPFLNFAAAGQVDPAHYGVSYWISHYVGNPAATTYSVYYKVNFTLRDAS